MGRPEPTPTGQPAYWEQLTEEQREQKRMDDASLREKLKKAGKIRSGKVGG